jgi:Ca-activated chloride channel family protein
VNATIDLPWALAAAVGLAVLAALAVVYEARRRRARLDRLGSESMLERLVPIDVLRVRVGRRPVWLAMSALFAGVAFAGPRWGAPRGATETQGIDVVFAMDASLSMLAHDDSPTRLERAKQEARRLRALSRGDRVGLVAFAGRSYILTPLTADDGALALFLDNLDPSIVGQPGSSLAAAIKQGVDLLGPALASDRALVVFTDGEAFDERDAVLTAARHARDEGVELILIGFGTERGSKILIDDGQRPTEKLDADGNAVITRYDGELLNAVAVAADGTLIEADATDKASRARAALSQLRAERRRVDARRGIPLRYQWFLAPAAILLLWDTIAATRRARVVVAALLLSVVIPGETHAQASKLRQDAEREYASGRALQAARLWRRALDSGDRSPQTLYNIGTAYLAADSLDTAIEVLERVAMAPVGRLRNDALFNLGLAYLKRGLAERGEVAATSLKNAVRAYRTVLLGQPADSAARWNYELSLRKLESASSGGGGGGGSPERQSAGAATSGELARDQAAQLLDAAAREETSVRARQRQPDRAPAVRGRDW